jgi:hypothetical protein
VPEGKDGAASAALQILLAESAHFDASFRWNEETGERRVTLILTLMTVAAGAAGIVANSVDIDARAKLHLVAAVALALFLLGMVTLARLVRRNVATDEYRYALDTIRRRMITLAGEDLRGYWPFPTAGKSFLKRYLGLTLLMATTNSILLVTAVVLWWTPPAGWAFLIGVVLLVVSCAAQTRLVRWLEDKLRSEVGLSQKP